MKDNVTITHILYKTYTIIQFNNNIIYSKCVNKIMIFIKKKLVLNF